MFLLDPFQSFENQVFKLQLLYGFTYVQQSHCIWCCVLGTQQIYCTLSICLFPSSPPFSSSSPPKVPLFARHSHFYFLVIYTCMILCIYIKIRKLSEFLPLELFSTYIRECSVFSIFIFPFFNNKLPEFKEGERLIPFLQRKSKLHKCTQLIMTL